MIEKPVYTITVQTVNESSVFERTFLFEPAPADIILALQDRLGQIERDMGKGYEDDDEYLSRELEGLDQLCEVVNAVSKPLCRVNDMRTSNPVCVAGTLVGIIFVQHHLALDRP